MTPSSRSFIALVALLLLNANTMSSRLGAEAPLNLLIIQTDEHNFRTLGCYRELMKPEQALMWGTSVVTTPNIDWIAHGGAICTSFYATTPVCSPSRAALVSGRYPQNTDVVTNNIPLNDNIVTFAEILRRQGYATGYAGKWHLDGNGKPQWAPKRQFGFADNRFMFNRGHWKQLEITEKGPRVAARSNRGVPSYSVAGATKQNFTTDFLTDRALEFIQKNAEKPFCYYISLPDPHGPDTVRAPYNTMFKDQKYKQPRTYERRPASIPAWGQSQKGGFNQSSYYGMVRCIDDNVGRLLSELRQRKILERTIIVFTSDHGDLRGEHHRQNKGVPYEASARVPFLIYCPSKIKGGTVVGQALSCVDFPRTVLGLMGVDASGQEQGRDATPLLLTSKAKDSWNDVAFLRGTGSSFGWLCAVTDRYKLVLSPVDKPWLFDLERDPDEVTNFVEHPAYRATVQRLAKAISNYAKTYKDPFIRQPRIRADVAWAISDEGEYRDPKIPPPRANKKAGGKKKKRKKGNNRKKKKGDGL